MTRKEFIKHTGLGALSVLLFSSQAIAANAAVPVSDNLATGGTVIGTSAPSNKKLTWIDTANKGTHKYWNGSAWVPVNSTWQ